MSFHFARSKHIPADGVGPAGEIKGSDIFGLSVEDGTSSLHAAGGSDVLGLSGFGSGIEDCASEAASVGPEVVSASLSVSEII